MKSLENIPVLVTGATGFVGSRLCETLSTKENAIVTGTGRNLDKVSHLGAMGIVLQEADIIDKSALTALVKDKKLCFI